MAISTIKLNSFPGGVAPLNGVAFPAAQVASSDPNTLDDYEEGTWTPTDASGAGLTFSFAVGNYVKIGKQVICNFSVIYPSTASGLSAAIAGLPFVSYNGSIQSGTLITGYSTANRNIVGNVSANGTGMQFLNMGFSTNVTNAQMSTFRQDGTIVYITP